MKTPEEFAAEFFNKGECMRDNLRDAIASRDRDIIERCAALVDRDAQANWDRSEPAGFRDDDAAETHAAVAMALEGLAKDIRALSPAGTARATPIGGWQPGDPEPGPVVAAGTAVPASCAKTLFACVRKVGHEGRCIPEAVPEVCGTCGGKRWVLRMSRPCPACSPGGEGG